MRVSLYSHINSAFVQYTNLHSSTGIQAKILCIAAIALGFVAACFLIYRSLKTAPLLKITPLNDLHKKEDISSTQSKKIEKFEKIEKVIKNPPMLGDPEIMEKSGIENLDSSMTQSIDPHASLLTQEPIISIVSYKQPAISLSFNEETTGETHDSVNKNTSDTSDSLKKDPSGPKPQDEISPQVYSSMGGELSSLNQRMITMYKNSIQLCENPLKLAKDSHDQISQKIDQLKVDIAGKEKKIDEFIQYLQPMRQGKTEFKVIAKFTYQPDDVVTLESGEKVKAKDHVGEMIHRVKVDKEFILINEKEALTYDPKGKDVAVMHGNRCTFAGEENGSNFKFWIFKTHWDGNEDLPWIQINWLADNAFVFDKEIFSGELEINTYKFEINYLSKELTRLLSEKIIYEQTIDRKEKEILILNKKIGHYI